MYKFALLTVTKKIKRNGLKVNYYFFGMIYFYKILKKTLQTTFYFKFFERKRKFRTFTKLAFYKYFFIMPLNNMLYN